ncbi:MAG: hypothetical protein EAZ66_07565, partial [Alphaproteobacteria bacterium]
MSRKSYATSWITDLKLRGSLTLMRSNQTSANDSRFELLRLAAIFAARGHTIWIKGPADELRTAWLKYYSDLFEAQARLGCSKRIIQCPAHTDYDALFGGTDLQSSLATGSIVRRAGLIAQGPLIIQMAERWDRSLTTELALAIDHFEPSEARSNGLIVLDESLGDDIPVSPSLTDRCTLIINLQQQPSSLIDQFKNADRNLLTAHRKLGDTSSSDFLHSL